MDRIKKVKTELTEALLFFRLSPIETSAGTLNNYH